MEVISWGGRSWKAPFLKGTTQNYDEKLFRVNYYRPFTKQHHYASSVFNHSFYSMKDFYPQDRTENKTIMIKGNWYKNGFLALMTNTIFTSQPDGGSKGFPLYIYEENKEKKINHDLFSKSENSEKKYTRKDGITDEALIHFQKT